MKTEEKFYQLWKSALAQPDRDIYISEHINDASPRLLNDIHKVAHITVREIIKQSGLTQKAFALRFCIPLRTVEDWASGKSKCKDYDRLMLCKILNIAQLP